MFTIVISTIGLMNLFKKTGSTDIPHTRNDSCIQEMGTCNCLLGTIYSFDNVYSCKTFLFNNFEQKFNDTVVMYNHTQCQSSDMLSSVLILECDDESSS